VDIDIPKKSTYEEINTAFNRVSDRATENDLILIFISSHAKMDSVNGLMILPRDYNKDEDGLNGLSCLDIMRFTYQPKCPKILFLDVCYAGGAAVNAIEGIKYLGQDLMSGQFSLLVGSNDAEGYESDSLRAGVMTHCVIKGLAGLADVHRPDGVVTLNELNGYISSEVSYITKGKQKSYMPINFNGDLPIFKYELKEKQKPIPLLPKKHQ
jgi:uncharacterized caspase-like protein